MSYYELKQRACQILDNSVKGAKSMPIDGLILKIETTTGMGAKFVRERLDRMAKMNHVTIDRIEDEVTWND